MRHGRRASWPLKVVLAAAAMAATAMTHAVPITGEELASSSSFDAPSTNALNHAMLVPGRIGQDAPFVLFDSATSSSVTLSFTNLSPAFAFFEYRIDGVTAGVSPHPIVAGDLIHPGVGLGSGVAGFLKTFNATSLVEIRLALGGERDWDFDWTAFGTVAAVPEPGTLGLLAVGLLGFGVMRRKRKA